jgi:hypothetical protein
MCFIERILFRFDPAKRSFANREIARISQQMALIAKAIFRPKLSPDDLETKDKSVELFKSYKTVPSTPS